MPEQSYENRLLRHRSLITSEAPSTADLRALLPTIKTCVSRARMKYRSVFDAMGVAREDLVSMGMVHGVHFLHRYGHKGNEGLLFSYLYQRLSEIAQVTKKKAENCSAADTSVILEADDVVDVQPAADSCYADGSYILCSDTTRQRLEVCGDDAVTPTLYLEDVIVDAATLKTIREHLAAGHLWIEAASEVEVLPDNDQAKAFIYAAINLDLDGKVRAAAIKLCKERYGLRYSDWRPHLKALKADVTSQRLIASGFLAAHPRVAPRGMRSHFAEEKTALRAALVAREPGDRECRRCHQKKPPPEFSIKVVRAPGAEPHHAVFCSYCKSCKREINKKAGK